MKEPRKWNSFWENMDSFINYHDAGNLFHPENVKGERALIFQMNGGRCQRKTFLQSARRKQALLQAHDTRWWFRSCTAFPQWLLHLLPAVHHHSFVFEKKKELITQNMRNLKTSNWFLKFQLILHVIIHTRYPENMMINSLMDFQLASFRGCGQ